MTHRALLLSVTVCACLMVPACAQEAPPQPQAATPPATPDAPASETPPSEKSLYEFSVAPLDDSASEKKSLAEFAGKVTLVVNVASKCGYTPQYKALQELYRELAEDGKEPFAVLAFPSNDFGEQEPGGAAEITKTCEKYSVSFPVFGKVSVTGPQADPLYKWILAQPRSGGEPPKWNFTKFLVDADGQVVARFDSRIRPNDPELRRKLDELLASARARAAAKSSEPEEAK